MLAHLYPTNSYDVAIGASSTTSGYVFPTGIKAALFVATSACRVEISSGTPVAAIGQSTLIPANFPIVLKVLPGQTVATIEQSAAGTLNITELV